MTSREFLDMFRVAIVVEICHEAVEKNHKSNCFMWSIVRHMKYRSVCHLQNHFIEAFCRAEDVAGVLFCGHS